MFGRDLPAVVRVLMSPRLYLLTFWLMQSPQAGALPIARAAADPSVRGGEYYGPNGWNEWTDDPVRVKSIPRSHDADADAQHRLWEVSDQLTGVTYRIGVASKPRPRTSP